MSTNDKYIDNGISLCNNESRWLGLRYTEHRLCVYEIEY